MIEILLSTVFDNENRITSQNLPRIVKEKSPEHPRSTAKHPHVVTDYGLTCGQTQKTGLFNPESREEKAHYGYHKNARFQVILRDNKRKRRFLRISFLV